MCDLFTERYFFSEEGVTINITLEGKILRIRVYLPKAAWGSNRETDVSFEEAKKEEIKKVAKHLIEEDTRKYLPVIKKLMEAKL